MANLFPFSGRTAERLSQAPEAGETHRWLAQVAGGLVGTLSPDVCAAYLRRCCEVYVAHRAVPEREIAAAVAFAYSGSSQTTGANYGRRAIAWPAAKPEAIAKTLAATAPAFDGETSTGLTPGDVLPALYRAGELVCTGAESERAIVRPVEAAVVDAERMQFICPNPMRGVMAANQAGRPSVRCQNNVALRRYLVAEFDDPGLSKGDQARLATCLGDLAPLVMAVDSGGKSVHAWFYVEAMSRQDQARLFAVACLLGADPTRWDLCGWLRMPGGLRPRDGGWVRQRILYWDPGAVGRTGTMTERDSDGTETQSA